MLTAIADDMTLDGFGRVAALPAAATHVPWDGPAVRVVEHPAHSPGHAALLVEEAGVLAAGDMLSDVFVPMLDDFTEESDPLTGYLTGLDRLAGLGDRARVAVPGHGDVAAGADEVRARIDLDRAYVVALGAGRTPDDPRLGPGVEPGWEWVADIHEGQARSVARWRGRG